MSQPAKLIELFYSSTGALAKFEPVETEDLPEAFQSLLAHQDHMTVTIEAWHNSMVNVRVLSEHRDGDFYSRQILLIRQRDDAVVQFGIMRIDLAGLPDIVRMEIESRALPLGRIMIRRHLMRDVELEQLWRVTPSDMLVKLFGGQESTGEALYGRTARILVDGSPAVELLEIVTQ
ncbi:hypothetical protein OAS39_05355 [Pirellulales bacterium]|nr:hypothetical protein [Pirellulales bacterium]